MIETIMTCDCCGKTFYSEYWEGGYIDHVTNFSRHFKSYSEREDVVEHLSKEIIFSGNNVRSAYEIDVRLNCAMKSIYFSDDVKTEVKRIVNEMLAALKIANTEADEIEQSASPMALAILKDDSLNDAYHQTYYKILEGE